MKKILFVCHGNICRSPMAEFVMKDLVEKAGLSEMFLIESAATSSEEIGNGVHIGTRRLLTKHGISCAGKTARRIVQEDYSRFDLLIGMDEANVFSMTRFFDGDPEDKVRLLLSYTGNDAPIADPWYTGDFEATWRDVQRGCTALLEFLRRQG